LVVVVRHCFVVVDPAVVEAWLVIHDEVGGALEINVFGDVV
jgi:hypothetical protein